MKNSYQEQLRRSVKQHHRAKTWRLNAQALHIPHGYPEAERRVLSWWDDFGFVLAKRRVMVWWVHPRMTYQDAISDRAWLEAGEPPEHDALLTGSKKIWKKVGRSRKKVAMYESRPSSVAMQAFYAQLNAIEKRLQTEGIDLQVAPSLKIEYTRWCVGVSLCMPFEVRNETDIAALAAIARRLLTSETTLAAECGNAQYGRAEWLADAGLRQRVNQEQVCV